jgi:Fe-S-cluster-containing dehydrogenase component
MPEAREPSGGAIAGAGAGAGARAADAGPAAWPSVIFDAPVLRGLDARARREIAEAGRLLTFEEGETIYRAGDGGDPFYVIASGSVALSAVRRGDDRETELRTASPGEVFGEEATIGIARRGSAVAKSRAVVAEVPVHIFRRVAERAGKAEMAGKLERILRRSATRDMLGTLAFTRDLSPEDIDALLDAVAYRKLERGQSVYRQGDPATEVWLVADGMIQIQTEDGERIHVRAYLTRGDFFGDVEVQERAPRAATAVASGPSLLLSIPARAFRELVEERPELAPRLRRLAADQSAAQQAIVGGAAKNHTQHVFRDLYRLQVARSLLVIDLESCVRCGHCAWACEDLYGAARLVRRGDKVIAKVADKAEAPSSLLLPNSCQHCENPTCMVGCPTGAIGRDPEGEVFIRPELCTGCSACAKACPWDNIQMAPRPKDAPRPPVGTAGDYAELAVKCDLCRDYEEGPACVQACPTSSIFRLNPAEEIADVRDLLGGSRPIQARATSLRDAAVVGAGLIAGAAVGAVGAVMQARGLWRPSSGLGWAAGVAAAVAFVLLTLYAAPKRVIRLWMRRRAVKGASEKGGAAAREEAPVTSVIKPQLAIHLAIGFVSVGLALSHAPWPPSPRPTVGGALHMVFLATAALGGLTALLYAFVPRVLSRIERVAALPEDFALARRELVDRLYREVSGRSDLVKKIFEKILLPYTKNIAGPVLLLASGRRLRDEEKALRARIDRVLEGRGAERLAGLAELVRLVVELRSLPAQRLLLRVLRVGLPLHVITFMLALVLLVLHIATARRYGG